ncbi:hypothetical protein IMQ36_11945 [Providencia rettgeri]|nr:hypothetical protein [Providencia rettgeri]QPE15907.1 hypothetical protein IMQ36_11945 [Providencia rettgeri]
MYNIGTVTTTANSPKITGTGTRWKDNTTLVSVGQVVLIENGSNLLINSIYSIESNTALTLAFPVSAKLTNAKYIILTTMIDSISDGVNKATAQVIASEVYTEILNQWMTAQGTIDVELPTGQKIKLRTVAEMDKQLDGKLNTNYPTATGDLTLTKSSEYLGIALIKSSSERVVIETLGDTSPGAANIIYRDKDNKNVSVVTIPKKTGTTMLVGDYGLGFSKTPTDLSAKENGFFNSQQFSSVTPTDVYFGFCAYSTSKTHGFLLGARRKDIIAKTYENNVVSEYSLYHTGNTTKDSNGNLKAASPVVKLFADDIELNEESEGVEMEHLGVGHYLIKGVVGFNADGAWGINNGFVIPQDHNGKNMVLIDYEVRPDGDIEVFVFHQQNADMPERFQNKRIKHFDEEGVPVYFENYEPCDVPESRWIDMRVEMPPNSLYNQKQVEAERLAKLEAERLAQEDAKRAAEEAERAEQEAAEQVEQQ